MIKTYPHIYHFNRYSDWYRPKPGWKQTPVFEDSFLPEIVDFDLKQPTADSSTLCSGFLYTSPHESLNWIKIPCDYPLFRAGVICKQPVSEDLQRNENITEGMDFKRLIINMFHK